MNQQLEKLIDLALADGVLTDKERQVLNKKALELGVDIDEFEMVLEGKLHLAQKEMQQLNSISNVQEAPSNKEGSLRKCPSCGAPTQGFATKCPDCGHEFRNREVNSGIQKLFELLNSAENNRANSTSSMFGKLQSVFGVNNVDKNKLEIISSFPIPNTKEDMLEFLALAMPKTKSKKFLGFIETDADKIPNMYARTWKSKCEQLIMKARFSMKNDKETLDEIEYYAKQIGIK